MPWLHGDSAFPFNPLASFVPFAVETGGYLAPWLRPSGLPSVGLEP